MKIYNKKNKCCRAFLAVSPGTRRKRSAPVGNGQKFWNLVFDVIFGVNFYERKFELKKGFFEKSFLNNS